jgi:hypothetical protein
MHGMLSAAILIGVFAVIAAVCLYMVARVLAAGRGQARGPSRGQVQEQAQVAQAQGQVVQGQGQMQAGYSSDAT